MNQIGYIALSRLVYVDIGDHNIGHNLGYIMDKNLIPADVASSDELIGLRDSSSDLRSWKLLAHQPNTPTGFAAAAFQSPEGQIIFAFRGTEPKLLSDPIKTVSDFLTDAQISIDGLGSNKAGQFPDTLAFIRTTLEKASGKSSLTNSEITNYVRDNNVTFTGHSLGGGLAQYAYSFLIKRLVSGKVLVA